jgi:hypothetical protein
MAVVAFTLGSFTFLGLQFLAYWPLVLGDGMAALIIFSAVWGAGIECFVWNGRLPLVRSRAASDPWLNKTHSPAVAAARRLGRRDGLGRPTAAHRLAEHRWLALAHRQYQCILVAAPFLSLPVFTITWFGQVPIVQALRQKGHDRAAFAALLILAAVMMLLIGELMTVSHYRKGLEHFRKDHSAIFALPASDRAEFFFDYKFIQPLVKCDIVSRIEASFWGGSNDLSPLAEESREGGTYAVCHVFRYCDHGARIVYNARCAGISQLHWQP